MRVILSLFLVLSIVVSSACSSKKHGIPVVIQTPKWVRGYESSNEFSAVGITSAGGKLNKRTELAKENGYENLKTNIMVHFENFLMQEMKYNCFNDKEIRIILPIILEDVISNLTIEKVKNLSRMDGVWDSANENMLYVLMVAEKKTVGSAVASSLDSLEYKYRVAPRLLEFITKLKQDILNNFEAKKCDCVINSDADIKPFGDMIKKKEEAKAKEKMELEKKELNNDKGKPEPRKEEPKNNTEAQDGSISVPVIRTKTIVINSRANSDRDISRLVEEAIKISEEAAKEKVEEKQ